MATKVEDRFKEQKTYEGFESDAKASGLYDTFDAKDIERAKTDANYGYDLLNYKKGWTAANESGDKEDEEFYAGMGQALRDSHDSKYSPKTSGSGTPTYSGALAAIKAYDDSLPGDKSSKYMTLIDSLFTQIAGDKFSYDAKSDPRYALAEEYAQKAMENQMAESALLTGGYGNSYAAAIGQQVYTDYMNDAVNDMEDRAYSMWSAERDNKYNLLGIAQGLEEQAYNRRLQGEERQAAEAAENFEKALLKAETLAAHGDYSGYRALGYTDEEIAGMQKYFDDSNAPNIVYEPVEEENPFDYSKIAQQFIAAGVTNAIEAKQRLIAAGYDPEAASIIAGSIDWRDGDKKLDLNELLAKNTSEVLTTDAARDEKFRLRNYNSAKNKAQAILQSQGADAAYTYLLSLIPEEEKAGSRDLDENDIYEILAAIGIG